jgi:hypothetical protein
MTIRYQKSKMAPCRKGHCAVLAAALLLLAGPRMASAYVDPGSGAMLWQLSVAGLVGALFYVRRVTRWLRSRLRSIRAVHGSGAQDPAPTPGGAISPAASDKR